MAIREVVAKFGGQSALARMLDKRPSMVAYWVKVDSIPVKWHRPLLELAPRHGVTLTSGDLVPAVEGPVRGDVLPVAQHPGTLVVGDFHLNCYVLDDGRRIISRTSATEFLTDGRGGGNFESYVEVKTLEPYLPAGWRD
ncbi:MAG: carph-isopro domain-containing protein, partial [Acidimicrobiales bacterium]